jgi:hypothetical protein
LKTRRKAILAARQLLAELYMLQDGPTPIFEDNRPAINIVNAVAVTRNSRHLHTRCNASQRSR